MPIRLLAGSAALWLSSNVALAGPWTPIAGTWTGLIADDLSYSTLVHWETSITLVDDAPIGAIIGTVDYRVVETGAVCGGNLTRLGEAGSTFSAIEDITYGESECYDGALFDFVYNPDGTLGLFWYTGPGEPSTWGMGQVARRDRDGDLLFDDQDNCPDAPNPLQEDYDGDLVGDACETTLHLTFAGHCPGPIDVALAHLTPGGSVAVLRSASTGSVVVPSGPCAGATVGLGAPITVAAHPTAGPEGIIQTTATFGPSWCGTRVQLVDLATCRLSPVVSVP